MPSTSSVMTGPPHDTTSYTELQTPDGFTIYLHNALHDKKERMTLTVSHFLCFRRIFEETHRHRTTKQE